MAETSPSMSKLAGKVKELVNEGVYSLFKVRNQGNAAYVLFAGNEVFFLNDEGAILRTGGSPQREDLISPVRFPSLLKDGAKRLNFASG